MDEKQSIEETVSHPGHYACGDIECKDAMRAMMMQGGELSPMAHYWRGCVFKYVWRFPLKHNGLVDLLKARQCLDFLIAELYPNYEAGE